MDEIQPYIIHLTRTQEVYLVNVMQQNQWKDTNLQRVDSELSFLIHFLVVKDKKQITLFKEVLKEALWNQGLLITEDDAKTFQETSANMDRSEIHVLSKLDTDSKKIESWSSVAANAADDVLNGVVGDGQDTKHYAADCEIDTMYVDHVMIKKEMAFEDDVYKSSSDCVLNNSGYTDSFCDQTQACAGKNGNLSNASEVLDSDDNMLVDPRTANHVDMIENNDTCENSISVQTLDIRKNSKLFQGREVAGHSVEGKPAVNKEVVDNCESSMKQEHIECISENETSEFYQHKVLSNSDSKTFIYKCEICGLLTSSKRTLNRHLERDHSERKQVDKIRRYEIDEVFVCTICKKQFVDKYTLNRHQLTMHTGDLKSEYQCDLCGATMRHKGSLVQHMKSVHSEDRPYKCDMCSSSFKLYQQLKTHKRRHGPDFVDTCMVCGKTVTKGHLNSHMKRHSNDRKYKCGTCCKAFYSKQDLDRHVLLHSGDKPNKCPYCEYCCAYKGNLTKHMVNRHEAELYIHGWSGKDKNQSGKKSGKKETSVSSEVSKNASNGNLGLNSKMEAKSKPITEQFEEHALTNTKSSGANEQDFSGDERPRVGYLTSDFREHLNRNDFPFVSSFSLDKDCVSKQTSYHLKRQNFIADV